MWAQYSEAANKLSDIKKEGTYICSLSVKIAPRSISLWFTVTWDIIVRQTPDHILILFHPVQQVQRVVSSIERDYTQEQYYTDVIDRWSSEQPPPPLFSMFSCTFYELFLSKEEHIAQLGYPVETHNITTEDGYILTYHRIPWGKIFSSSGNRPPVLVQHGIFAVSPGWATVNTSLGIVVPPENYIHLYL